MKTPEEYVKEINIALTQLIFSTLPRDKEFFAKIRGLCETGLFMAPEPFKKPEGVVVSMSEWKAERGRE